MINQNLDRFYGQTPVRILKGFEGLEAIRHLYVTKNTLILTSSDSVKRPLVKHIIAKFSKDSYFIYSDIQHDPDINAIDRATKTLFGMAFDQIIAIGGGSVIDTAKALAISIQMPHPTPILDVLKENTLPSWHKAIKLTAIPTTSGTGSEVTPFATLWDKVNGVKYSMSNNCLYPKTAILIPELTLTLPMEPTLYTAMDSLSHSLESIWNKNSSEDVYLLAKDSIKLIIENLPNVLARPEDVNFRSHLQDASLMAGIAISKTRTAIAHSISYPLTSRYGVPHGLAASFTLLKIIEKLESEGFPILRDSALLKALKKFLISLNLPARISLYITKEQIKECIPQMVTPDRAGNFVIDLSLKEISTIVISSV